MAFADVKPRTLIQGWGQSQITLGADVVVGDLIGMNATNEWVLAKAAATAVLARYIAAEDGDDGDEISVFRMAKLHAEYDAAAGEIGDVVYLSDTAGETALAAGATTQVVGWVDADEYIMVNPRNPLQIDASDIANDSIDSEHYAADSIDTEHYAAASVDMTALAADSVQSSQYVDGSIDMIHLSADAVQSSQYADGSIDMIHMSADSVDSSQYVNGSIDMIHLSADSVDSSQYVDASIDMAHLSENSVQSSQYVDGSIDMIHMSENSVESSQYADGSIDMIHLSADAVQSSQYVDGSIDMAHLSADSVESSQYVNGSIDAAHLDPTLITGFIPLDITLLRQIVSNDVAAVAVNAGLLASDSTPILERFNAATDKSLRVTWTTVATEDSLEVQFPTVPMPVDLNAAVTLSVHLIAAMGGGTDTPAFDVQVWDGTGDAEMGGVTGHVATQTPAEYTRDVQAANIAGPPLGFLNIQLVPEAHTTDQLYLYAAWIEYERG